MLGVFWKIQEISNKMGTKKTRLLIVGGGRVNGESILPRPSSGETLGEL